MAKHINKRPVNPDKWYICDTNRVSSETGLPRLLKKTFDNKYQAKRAVEEHLKGMLNFDFIKGSDAIELGMTIMNYAPYLCDYVSDRYLRKYQYNLEDTTWRNKKTYRTRFRRHQRAKKGEYYKRKA